MGYYTDYSLSILSDMNADVGVDVPNKPEAMVAWSELHLGEGGGSIFEELLVDNSSWNGKWYDHEDDMRKLSAAFQGVLFELCAKGEDDDDYWKKYFLDGKMQVCKAEVKVIYPDHDPSLMK